MPTYKRNGVKVIADNKDQADRAFTCLSGQQTKKGRRLLVIDATNSKFIDVELPSNDFDIFIIEDSIARHAGYVSGQQSKSLKLLTDAVAMVDAQTSLAWRLSQREKLLANKSKLIDQIEIVKKFENEIPVMYRGAYESLIQKIGADDQRIKATMYEVIFKKCGYANKKQWADVITWFIRNITSKQDQTKLSLRKDTNELRGIFIQTIVRFVSSGRVDSQLLIKAVDRERDNSIWLKYSQNGNSK